MIPKKVPDSAATEMLSKDQVGARRELKTKFDRNREEAKRWILPYPGVFREMVTSDFTF